MSKEPSENLMIREPCWSLGSKGPPEDPLIGNPMDRATENPMIREPYSNPMITKPFKSPMVTDPHESNMIREPYDYGAT